MSLMSHGGQPLVSGQPSEKTCQRLLLTRSLKPCISSMHFHLGYIKLQQGPRVPDPPAHFCPFIFTFPLTLSGGDFSPPKQYFPCGIFCIHTNILIDLTPHMQLSWLVWIQAPQRQPHTSLSNCTTFSL